MQFHTALGYFTSLNFTSRYTSAAGDSLAFTHKNQQLLLSYHRTVLEQAATTTSPPLNFAIASELRIHTGNMMSQWAIGLQHTRALYKYQACITNDPAVSFLLEQHVNQSVGLQLTGEMKYDGSNEAKFGIGIHLRS